MTVINFQIFVNYCVVLDDDDHDDSNNNNDDAEKQDSNNYNNQQQYRYLQRFEIFSLSLIFNE